MADDSAAVGDQLGRAVERGPSTYQLVALILTGGIAIACLAIVTVCIVAEADIPELIATALGAALASVTHQLVNVRAESQ